MPVPPANFPDHRAGNVVPFRRPAPEVSTGLRTSMEPMNMERRLAAILYADVAGYSRLTGADETGTHRTLVAYLDLVTTAIGGHGGRVVHLAGDAVLAEFASVVAALRCAVEIQEELGARNQDLPEDRRLRFRIGLDLGEVIVDRDEIYGDHVNVAARLEGIAPPGGICVSQRVREQVAGKLNLDFEDMGGRSLRNIARPVRAYRVIDGPLPVAVAKEISYNFTARPRRRRAKWGGTYPWIGL